ncbi:MAG: hypothetical protein R3234_01745 [Thermoanaerobaculia bacterium]|nr:hypothetical protein [Thermoanaerobaculia bacterium]
MAPRIYRIVLALLVLALLGIGFQYFFSDRARLNRRLTELEELLSKEGPEEQIEAATNARAVTRMLAPGFVLVAAPYEGTITDPRQVFSGALRLRQAGSAVDVDFGSREIEIRPGSATGVAGFLARVTIDLGDRTGREGYRVRTVWTKEDGTWLLAEAEVLEVLEGDEGLRWW